MQMITLSFFPVKKVSSASFSPLVTVKWNLSVLMLLYKKKNRLILIQNKIEGRIAMLETSLML